MSVLLCYDGSPSARQAVSLAAETLLSDSITLLHVWHPPTGLLADSGSGADADAEVEPAGLDQNARWDAERILAEGQALAAQSGLDAECRLERNRVSTWRTILRVAREIDARLIVIGTRGQVPVQHSLVGSVSRAVVQHAPIPVLVVPTSVDRHEYASIDGPATSGRPSRLQHPRGA
jgi:nucleotide-binding universal stress UspA family protein